MKKIIYLLFLLLSNVTSHAQMPEYKLSQFGLKGEVQSVTERTGECVEKFGEYTFASDEVSYRILHFNSVGKLTTLTEYNTYGRMEWFIKYTYDKANMITMTTYNEDGTVNTSTDLMLSPKNSSDKLYTFFDNGALKTESFLTELGNVYEKYTYNSSGQVTERRKYKTDVPTDVFSYTYDGNGILQSLTRTRMGGGSIRQGDIRIFEV